MAYYPLKKERPTFLYQNESLAFDVGPNKDSYSLEIKVSINPEDDTMTYSSVVCKNWIYEHLPKDGVRKAGRKYREYLFEGNLVECYAFIHEIVKKEGYLEQVKGRPFEQELVFPKD